jgi:CO/xanthine dehydrogenase FAD-binding subunit
VPSFAGGTDLMVLLESGKLVPGRYVSIWGLRELQGITVTPAEVMLGALTTYTEVLSHSVLQSDFPLLCAAARETGGIATQNRGTLGGNIANASPAADSPPALLAYDAELELVSIRGARRVPYERFHSGYKVMDLAPDEIIHRIILPRRHAPWRQVYRKIGTRRAQAISKVCFAAAVDLDGSRVRDVRVALGSVAPTVVRCVHAETALRGRALDAYCRGGVNRADSRRCASRRFALDGPLPPACGAESADRVSVGVGGLIDPIVRLACARGPGSFHVSGVGGHACSAAAPDS